METIYETGTPCLSLTELAEELELIGELNLKDGERTCDCRLLEGETFVIDIIVPEGGKRQYGTDIEHLRDIGIGGTAKYIAFGRDDGGCDCLYTFM